ncbi:hypothetical protein [Micromonospora chokoriensis]|uniref:Uncharacterized protein n=1 Tax=Micromonospora chokoriensis TaxID=356851 RepID=A0A1C4WN26_9ACTN|nr:hypothetical protein [Micromonospora chokoriensis]SCE97553.1 hypothetical protein GA0070612_2642 [Micromonospora chokoriensis]
MATAPNDDDNAVRSYPDQPQHGTATNNGGAKHVPTNEKKTTIPMRIARVGTIPMTAEDLDNAAEALAVLLNQFWREHPNLAA